MAGNAPNIATAATGEMPFHRIKSNILEPFRTLCEYNRLNFFVVVQTSVSSPSSSSSSSFIDPGTKRYWSSSNQMFNFCGDLIKTCATYVDVSLPATEVDLADFDDDVKIEEDDAVEKDT